MFKISSTVYPTIYLPKWKFWIQLSPNYILIAYKSSHEKTGFLHYENTWIQCISNVNTIGITSDWYDLYFHCSKTMISWEFWDWYRTFFQKTIQEGCLSEITHVVTSTSKIMMSLFDLVCQFASDAYAKAHAVDFLYMLISCLWVVKIWF